uniref:Threonine synthase n=1 Tax=Echinococcus granulosus TaxID=6210 RepID=A0A068WYB3_ECHGR|nr:hypothetical protein EgrG_002063600 [Echinococcus granulosus]
MQGGKCDATNAVEESLKLAQRDNGTLILLPTIFAISASLPAAVSHSTSRRRVSLKEAYGRHVSNRTFSHE